jgi:hypothetical protein
VKVARVLGTQGRCGATPVERTILAKIVGRSAATRDAA